VVEKSPDAGAEQSAVGRKVFLHLSTTAKGRGFMCPRRNKLNLSLVTDSHESNDTL
jgi:hypothetical protein